MATQETHRARLKIVPFLVLYAYLFFLAIDMMGKGMKSSFAEPLKAFLVDNGAEFTEIRSFVIGVIGTSFVQSSSTVTSMSVVLTQEGVIPLIIAVGIVHGANLGTSVTSSIVAFATSIPKGDGSPLRWVRNLLFKPRGEGFERAVGTAVVHDFFNIIMITGILLLLELPFGIVLGASEAITSAVEGGISASDHFLEFFALVSPKTYTKPVIHLVQDAGMPSGLMALAGLLLLFGALKGFSATMNKLIVGGPAADDDHEPESLGDRLLGRTAFDTFMRGLVLTILVQSSSATTSLVVPLAALGMFRVDKVFPFIMGANIGTTTTALLAATAGIGQAGFHEGMTIALCHVLLNTSAVLIAWWTPGLQPSIIGAARFLGRHAARRPVWLLVYLGLLTVVVPAIVYVFPQAIAGGMLGLMVLGLIGVPHLATRLRDPDAEALAA